MAKYDVAVIGAGPAGLEAAVNLNIRRKNVVLFGSGGLSSKITAAPRIDNYLGLPGISGKELAERFRQHLSAMGIPVREEMVSTIYPMGSTFAIATNHDTLEAAAVILATGAFSAKLLPGEEAFLGRGVGYCATCDAPLYRGKTVAVVGYSDDAVEEANFIAGLAGKTYYIPGRAPEKPLAENIEVVRGVPVEIRGERKAGTLVLRDREISADGIFLLRESVAPASLVPGIELEDGFIRVDKSMRTNFPGCFAAGDCTGKPHQYMRAAGQGQIAGLAAAAYVDQSR